MKIYHSFQKKLKNFKLINVIKLKLYHLKYKKEEFYSFLIIKLRFVYNFFLFIQKETRIIFGPALAILEPDEEFTVLNLSGGAPKKEN